MLSRALASVFLQPSPFGFLPKSDSESVFTYINPRNKQRWKLFDREELHGMTLIVYHHRAPVDTTG